MPPSREDALREVATATARVAREQKALREEQRTEMRALRRAVRAGFKALGAQIEGLDDEEERGALASVGGAASAPTGPQPLAPTGPHPLVEAPAPAPTETTSMEVRVDAHGFHASAAASPSWLRRYWKWIAFVILFVWGGFAAVEKGLAVYHRLRPPPGEPRSGEAHP